MNCIGKNFSFKLIVSGNIQNFISALQCSALPISMYFWEKFWDIWATVVFSDGRVNGAIMFGMFLDYKKGDRASAKSCPQCV